MKYDWLHADTSQVSIVHLEKAIKVYPNQPLIRKALFKIHWVAGRREEAKDQLIELLDRFHNSYGSCHFAEMYFLMGKEERAYHWLQKAIDAKESFVPLAGVNPSLKNITLSLAFGSCSKQSITRCMWIETIATPEIFRRRLRSLSRERGGDLFH